MQTWLSEMQKLQPSDPKNPVAEAFAIKDGVFYRVGSNSSVSDLNWS